MTFFPLSHQKFPVERRNLAGNVEISKISDILHRHKYKFLEVSKISGETSTCS